MNRFYLINHHNSFIQKYITNVESFMNLVNLINKSLTNEITTKPWWWFTISDLNKKTFCRILTNRVPFFDYQDHKHSIELHFMTFSLILFTCKIYSNSHPTCISNFFMLVNVTKHCLSLLTEYYIDIVHGLDIIIII